VENGLGVSNRPLYQSPPFQISGAPDSSLVEVRIDLDSATTRSVTRREFAILFLFSELI
jgi:hypothetical protein